MSLSVVTVPLSGKKLTLFDNGYGFLLSYSPAHQVLGSQGSTYLGAPYDAVRRGGAKENRESKRTPVRLSFRGIDKFLKQDYSRVPAHGITLKE